MQIKLSDDSTVSMFFLGDPKNLIASLTFVNPGPIEVDFDSLDKSLQLKILNALQQGVLESDAPFPDLYQKWAGSPQVTIDETPQEAPKADSVSQQRMALELERKEKEEKFTQRCSSILKNSFKAIKALLAGEDDTRLFRTLLQIESANRQRNTVMAYIKEKIRQEEDKIAKKISKEAQEQIESKKGRVLTDFETRGYSVIESEQKTVVLTPDDLIRLTIGK